MVICNEAGEKVAMVQRKLLALKSTFQVRSSHFGPRLTVQPSLSCPVRRLQVYTYKPNQEGQESTEDDSGTPVYRFAMVERQLLTMTPEFCWKLYKGNDDPTTVLLAKVQMSVAGE